MKSAHNLELPGFLASLTARLARSSRFISRVPLGYVQFVPVVFVLWSCVASPTRLSSLSPLHKNWELESKKDGVRFD